MSSVPKRPKRDARPRSEVSPAEAWQRWERIKSNIVNVDFAELEAKARAGTLPKELDDETTRVLAHLMARLATSYAARLTAAGVTAAEYARDPEGARARLLAAEGER